MITPITSMTRLARQARAFSVPLLVTGALAAGCGTVGSGTSASDPGAKAAGTTSASAPASAPAPSASPVPTVAGGAVVGGDCAGWPTNAARGTLTAFFEPVAVERCVIGFEQVPGKGEWETATLEKSTDVATLTEVLLRPSSPHQPGIFCAEFVVIPPQIVLISSTGKEIIPRLPVGACGSVVAEVLSTLDSMAWQQVSVRLIAKIAPAAVPTTFPGASLAPGSPVVLPTGSNAAAPDQPVAVKAP
jgi:hypothetical protein